MKTMPIIRNFEPTDADYAAITQIANAVWPDQHPAEAVFRYEDETRPADRYYQRLVIEKEGQVVGTAGYLETWWSAEPDEYYWEISIDPDWQRQGIGDAVYQYINSVLLREKTVVKLVSTTRDDKEAGVRFLEKRGYTQNSRYPRSTLDVQAFDPAPFTQYAERVASHQIVIKTLTELMAQDEDWARKLWDLHWVVAQDEPGPIQPARQPLELFIKRNTQGPGFNGDAYFVATDGDHYAGLSQLWLNENYPQHLHQGWTGVDRSYRQKGIATALKVRTIAWAKQFGATQIEADNFETNPMYDINMRLGFRPASAFLEYQLEIKDA